VPKSKESRNGSGEARWVSWRKRISGEERPRDVSERNERKKDDLEAKPLTFREENLIAFMEMMELLATPGARGALRA
jgi:hypothetical protein